MGEDIEAFRFNTAISAFMEFHNEIKAEPVSLGAAHSFLKLLYPFAPHLSEELYQKLGGKKVLQQEAWPEFNAALLVDSEVELVVQVNGKVRGKLIVDAGEEEAAVKAKALELPAVKQALVQDSVKRVIYIKGRLINLVV
ncbi:MAG: class I tRNA ligase family protein [Patescibacteria group bacterium]|nr:class I tRNA ligase family protein [Patescibacteria group bacterium]